MAKRLPHYHRIKGWIGGEKFTLYAITDKRTGHVLVRPNTEMAGVGPECTIRIATRSEAEKLWQSPLHSGWKVST